MFSKFAKWIGRSHDRLTRGKSIALSTFKLIDAKSIDNMAKKKPLTQLLQDFNKVHGSRYCYDQVNDENYENNRTKIPVICKEHGLFHISVWHHLIGQGCPICANIQRRLSNTGNVRKRTKLVWGVGKNDYEGNIKYNKVHIPSYHTWEQMLKRCYDEKFKEKNQTYKDCCVCDAWLSFANFKVWFDENYVQGYALDKDILIKGNKIYSPQTCSFVPIEINSLLTNSQKNRGDCPIGVHFRKDSQKYFAYVSNHGKRENIGFFDNVIDAFNAYKTRKEEIIKEMAQEYFDNGMITEKVYQALMNYEVEITD